MVSGFRQMQPDQTNYQATKLCKSDQLDPGAIYEADRGRWLTLPPGCRIRGSKGVFAYKSESNSGVLRPSVCGDYRRTKQYQLTKEM
jgi:hypothetical protein